MQRILGLSKCSLLTVRTIADYRRKSANYELIGKWRVTVNGAAYSHNIIELKLNRGARYKEI
jgi:hypothetical protein